MKKFTVTLDVVFTGDIEIQAKNIAEARKLAKNKLLILDDIKNFYHTGLNKVVDII